MPSPVGRRGCGDVHFRAVSAYARDSNCELFDVPPERVTVVPRGISIGGAPAGCEPVGVRARRRRPVVRQRRPAGSRRRPSTCSSTPSPRSAPRSPSAELAIAGAPGSAEPTVRAAIARHGLDGAVHLLGWRDDVRALVAAADVFVFSSLSEGSPSAVLEAMAIGTPVVAFAIAPVVELTGGHARLAHDGIVCRARPGDAGGVHRPGAGRTRSPPPEAWADRFALTDVARQLGDLLEWRAGRRAEPARAA